MISVYQGPELRGEQRVSSAGVSLIIWKTPQKSIGKQSLLSR